MAARTIQTLKGDLSASRAINHNLRLSRDGSLSSSPPPVRPDSPVTDKRIYELEYALEEANRCICDLKNTVVQLTETVKLVKPDYADRDTRIHTLEEDVASRTESNRRLQDELLATKLRLDEAALAAADREAALRLQLSSTEQDLIKAKETVRVCIQIYICIC